MSYDRSGYKIFCGNMTRESDDLDLKNYFEKYGELTDYIVMKTGNTKRNRGFGFVSFKNEEDFEKVLADCPHTINNQQVTVQKASNHDVDTKPGDYSAKGDAESEIMRKLYVGGLNMKTTEETLRRYFARYGKIKHVTSISRVSEISKKRYYSIIIFEKSSGVDKCQNDRPHIIDKTRLDVKRATPRVDDDKQESEISVKKLFVGKITEEISDDDLKEYFGQFGEIEDVEQSINESGKKRGFGFIKFVDSDPVDKIVLLGHHYVSGTKLEVKKALLEIKNGKYNQAKADARKEREKLGFGRGGGTIQFRGLNRRRGTDYYMGSADKKYFGFSSTPDIDPRMAMETMMSWMGPEQVYDMMNQISDGRQEDQFGSREGPRRGGYESQRGGNGGQRGGYGLRRGGNEGQRGGFGSQRGDFGGPAADRFGGQGGGFGGPAADRFGGQGGGFGVDLHRSWGQGGGNGNQRFGGDEFGGFGSWSGGSANEYNQVGRGGGGPMMRGSASRSSIAPYFRR